MSGSRRIHELDLLRGFFILVIIIDHLQFWPSPLSYITGEGRLWASAAEGFFLISGLLIGYIRGFKGRHTPLKILSKKLVSRAIMLYVWGVGITVAITGFTLLIGNHDLLPRLPDANILASPLTFFWAVISGQFFNDWIYFLRLYAIMLLVTPLFLWLLRKGQTLIIVSLILLGYIAALTIWKEPALVWQVLFFGAAIVGYKLEAIISFLQGHQKIRRWSSVGIISITGLTMLLSYFFVHGWDIVESPGNPIMTREAYVGIREWLDPIFSSSPMQPGRIVIAFIWFAGLFAFFNILKRYVLKYIDWLLTPFGQRSLSAYCLQALLLPLIVVTIPVAEDELINGFVGLAVVISFWVILKVPIIQKILPV